ncbi:competence protein CoiA family protein [Klebsiella pneumoniae]
MRRNAQKWIPFGFDTDSNKIVDIASVENGLSCNCICLICGTSLIARQGQNKKWHFSHSTEVKGVGNDSNLLIVFYVQIMPDDFVMQLHRF